VEHGLRPRWSAERVAACVRDPETEVVVAWRGGRLAAFAIAEFRFEARRAHLVLLAVSQAERRRGVGRAVLAWIEKLARRGGIASLDLELRAGNAPARRFYASLGFREIGRVAGYYDGREDARRLRYTLD
jgi:ribosomal-protein-alanine N-acetyltransferase